jgi:hypothetical protein
MHQGRRIVDEQQARIRRLREGGSSTVDAENLLNQFIGTLAIFEDECWALEQELRTRT